jgi:hypothetical protein
MPPKQSNDYELLGNDKDNAECSRLIDVAIEEFVERMKVLHKKFPKCGLGDTATDEAIAGVVYTNIHIL